MNQGSNQQHCERQLRLSLFWVLLGAGLRGVFQRDETESSLGCTKAPTKKRPPEPSETSMGMSQMAMGPLPGTSNGVLHHLQSLAQHTLASTGRKHEWTAPVGAPTCSNHTFDLHTSTRSRHRGRSSCSTRNHTQTSPAIQCPRGKTSLSHP